MPRPRTSAAALLALTAVTAALAAGPAAAASAADDPNWWYDAFKIPDAHAAGFTGAGVKIGVIDSAINPDLAVFQGADLTVHEPAFCGGPAATTNATTDSVHGSDVTALLLGNGTGPGAVRGAAPGAAVTFYGIDAGSEAGSSRSCNTEIGGRTYSAIGRAIRQAVADGNRVISISLVSSAQNDGDIYAVTQALARGIVIVAGGENSTIETTSPFPHRANGVVSVNAIKDDGSLQTQGGGGVAAFRSTTVVAGGWGFSSQAAVKPAIAWGDNAVRIAGSSLATPLVSSMLAMVAQKYPKATGNQLIQTLIRNTGVEDHELLRSDDGYGYGTASVTHMLRVDPTRYPDENPLMDEPDHLDQPTKADVAAMNKAHAVQASAGPGRPGAAGQTETSSPIATALIVAGVVGGLIVIAGVVLLIVLLSRRRPPTRR